MTAGIRGRSAGIRGSSAPGDTCDSCPTSLQPQPDLTQAIISALLAWIAGTRRDLPWRQVRQPYAVWVSEVMLQQTQVATVVGYFERWMARFPDVKTLAEAPLAEVLKVWEGLGYYARAHSLRRAAQQVADRHGGQIPADREALLALPGIGRSTAGAILSLAFGQHEPILDGNVRRVFCRLYDIGQNPKVAPVEQSLWELARNLVEAAPEGAAGDLNEALMELGALVCRAGSPACHACPLRRHCLARERGVEKERPARIATKPLPHQVMTAGIARNASGAYLIVQRPTPGLLGGLWGFPGGPLRPGEELATALERNVREQVGLTVAIEAPLIVLKHAYTHFRITLHAFHCRLVAGEAQALRCADVRWVAPTELSAYPLPITDLRLVRALHVQEPPPE